MYKRREARIQALIIIFENMFTQESISCITRMAEKYRNEKIIPFAKKIAKYSYENTERIEYLINKYSTGWTIDRISKVLLALLKTAISEILFIENVPINVSINEYIEISKNYLSDEETGFMHGILGSIMDNEKIL